jgi:hypothetical protein
MKYLPQLFALGSLSLLLAGCSTGTTQPPAAEKASLTAKTADGLQGAQIVLSQNNQALDTVDVSAAGQNIQFTNLEPGAYVITIKMPGVGGLEFNTTLAVKEGEDLYLGVITKEDRGVPTDSGWSYPGDPAYPYPLPESDFIAYTYPANGETVTLYQYSYATIGGATSVSGGAPADTTVTNGDPGTIGPMPPEMSASLYISVQFSKTMDRQSVLGAFSITPNVDGTPSTDYWVDYWWPGEPVPMDSLPYMIMFDNTPAETVAVGAEIRSLPMMYPDTDWVEPAPSAYARSFSFAFTPVVAAGDTATYTVSFAGTARDSAGQAVQPYTFTFKVVAETLSVTPLPEPLPGCDGMACTMRFDAQNVLVVDAQSQPLDSLVTFLRNIRTNDTVVTGKNIYGAPAVYYDPSVTPETNSWGPGFYTILDDSYTWYLSTEPDSFQFSAIRGADTVSALYVFNTDSCRCHINKISGPDSLVMP